MGGGGASHGFGGGGGAGVAMVPRVEKRVGACGRGERVGKPVAPIESPAEDTGSSSGFLSGGALAGPKGRP
jgi:hypothetical protein